MVTARLAWRVLRGSGAAGLVRLMLMVVGLAVGVAVVTVACDLPGVLSARASVVTQRQPIPATDPQPGAGTDRVGFRDTPGWWDGRPLTRVFVSGQATAEFLVPPGLDRLPRPGEVFLSPAAREALTASPGFAALVPGRATGQIGPAGLTGPDELYAYVGVGADDAGSLTPVARWDRTFSGPDVVEAEQFRAAGWILALLVLPAGVIYLRACARVAVATRRRRYAALTLCGAGPGTVRRLAMVESGVAAMAGIAAGRIIASCANPWLASEGVLGFTWYPQQVTTSPVSTLGIVITALAGVLATGRFAASTALRSPLGTRREVRDRRPSVWLMLPAMVGVALLIPVAGGGATGSSGSATALLLAGSALASLGIVVALGPLVVTVAAGLRSPRFPLPLRLGAARLDAEAGSSLGLSSGLTALVLIAGIGSGLLGSIERAAGPDGRPVLAHVYLNEVAADRRGSLARVAGPSARWVTTQSFVPESATAATDGTPARWQWRRDHVGVAALWADCALASRVLGQPLSTCRDGHFYRLPSPGGEALPPGVDITFRTAARDITVATPDELLPVRSDVSNLDSAELLWTGGPPPWRSSPDATQHYVLQPSLTAVDSLATQVAELAPTAVLNLSLDLRSVQSFRVYRSTLTFSAGLASALALLAFVITALGRSLDRRRQVVSLSVLGVRRRTVSGTQVVFTMVPLVLSLPLAVAVGTLVANALSRVDHPSIAWSWTSARECLPVVAFVLVIGGLSSLARFGTRITAADLRRE